MTITYPRDMPTTRLVVARCTFDYDPIGGLSQTLGGEVSFQESVGGALWRLKITTKPLREADYRTWHAWILSLKSGGTFRGYDPRNVWPGAYGPAALALPDIGGSGTWDGTASVTAAAGETLSFSGLPANYRITEGDYIGFQWLGGQFLVKALETKTANGSGALTGLSAGPWRRTGGTVPATAKLTQPSCLMKIRPGSWSGERTVNDSISFEAVQTLA